jgi:hypothetical protein
MNCRFAGEKCFSKKNEVFLEEEEMSKHAKGVAALVGRIRKFAGGGSGVK